MSKEEKTTFNFGILCLKSFKFIQKRIDAKSNLEKIFEISGIHLLEIHNFKEGDFFKVPL